MKTECKRKPFMLGYICFWFSLVFYANAVRLVLSQKKTITTIIWFVPNVFEAMYMEFWISVGIGVALTFVWLSIFGIKFVSWVWKN
jgi:hypothetical protein